MSDYKYYYDEYYNDVSDFVDNYRLVKNPHIVGVYSDGLPAAVHISNALKCPLSIVKVEDDKAKWLFNYTEDRDLRPDSCPLFPRLIVIDTVYASGNQFAAIKQLPEFIDNPDYSFFSFFGCKNDNKVFYKYEQVYKNILFPWHDTRRFSELKMR
jgi:hypothetical protein